jgi:serine/threonine protein kinase
MAECPPEEELRRYLDPDDAGWDADRRQSIEGHVETCARCREQLSLWIDDLGIDLGFGRAERLMPGEYRGRFPGQTGLVDAAFDAAPPQPLGQGVVDPSIVFHRPGQPAAAAYAAPAVPGYVILGELGRGAMGVVYKARQVDLRRVVALKMILAGAQADPRELARFRREAETVARLQHPNIVTLYGVGEQGGRPYISLEYVAGGSLADRLDGTPIPARQAAQLAEILARAMSAAHQRGIVHRDLKPANVLLEADGTPKITDFGLAKRLDDPTGPISSGAILGTPSYMAPEQAAGQIREIARATDVYALGAILYELLTGRPPFRAATSLETLWQVIADEPVPPRLLVPSVPRDLEAICVKCLHKDPRQRYPDAGALAEDLRCFLAGEPIRARPMSLREKVRFWQKHKPWVAGNVLSFLIAVLVSARFLLGTPATTPGVLVFWMVLLGLIWPSRLCLYVGGIIVIGGTIACLMAGASLGAAWLSLMLRSLVMGAGIAACFGFGARISARYWGRPVWETLSGTVMGACCWLIVICAFGEIMRTVSGGWPWTLPAQAVMGLGSLLISTTGGGMAQGTFYAWRERWRSGWPDATGRRSNSPRGASPPSPPLPSTITYSPPGSAAVPDGPTTGPHLGSAEPSGPSPSAWEGPASGWPRVAGYEILDVLGRGGMGVVYKARQVGTDRLVALKLIRAGRHAGEAERERFSRETQALARLDHPNIVQVFETGESVGQPYFALEYVAGGSLADRLRGQPMLARPAAQLVQTLARAVQAAHQQGVIHRDLKPLNVLLTPDGHPKIADFGLARLMDEAAGLTASGAILGTPSYMAPEQAAGQIKQVSPASDIYALGAILYELLTGRPPFRAATALETLGQVLTFMPVPPRLLQPKVPRDLEAICLRCLEKRPRRRYVTATALAEDLGYFLASEPTRARPLPLWKRLVTRRSRHADGLADEFSLVTLLALTLLGLPACLATGVLIGNSLGLALIFVVPPYLVGFAVLLWRDRRKPRRLTPSEMVPSDEPVMPGGDGWITAPLVSLRFPPLCSDCGVPTTDRIPFHVQGLTHRLELDVPVCGACQSRFRRERWFGSLVGLTLGIGVASLLVVWLTGKPLYLELALLMIFLISARAASQHWRSFGRLAGLILGIAVIYLLVRLGMNAGHPGSVVLMILWVSAGAALCAKIGAMVVSAQPVHMGRYAPRRGTLALHFRNPDYAAKWIALMKADAQARNNVRIRLSLTPEQAASGTTARVVVHRSVRCPDCRNERNRKASCPSCTKLKATLMGRLLGPRSASCPLCGDGRRDSECAHCDGFGFLVVAKDLTISIPPESTTGTQLRVRGQGNEGPPGTSPGDLAIDLEVR